MSQTCALVADVGGTNTRVALCQNGKLLSDTIARFRNKDFDGIEPILQAYLQDKSPLPEAVCIDIAGPVRDGHGHVTNLDWHVSRDSLCSATGAGFADILNDMQAQGHAVPYLPHDSLSPILPGTPPPGASTRLVINVGTGLNASLVMSLNGQTLVPAAEAGHISLQARTEEELRLLQWIEQRHGVVGLEDLVSGRGFERVYAWVCADENQGDPLAAGDILRGFENNDPKARRALQIFARFFGRYAGDLALITLPYGGIFLVGGVMQHLGRHLIAAGFDTAFSDKGRFADFVSQFPMYLVTDDYAALSGCASHLAEISQG